MSGRRRRGRGSRPGAPPPHHRPDIDVGLFEDREQIAAAGLLEQLVGHREVGVHAGGQNGQLAEAHRLAGLLIGPSIEGEAAHNQDLEVAAGFEGGLADEVRPDGAVLRPDRDGHAPSGVALAERAGGLEEAPGERIERLEAKALALDPLSTPDERRLSRIVSTKRPESSIGAGGSMRSSGPSATTRWGERLSTVNGPATRTSLRSNENGQPSADLVAT